jgi:hypothetical protein
MRRLHAKQLLPFAGTKEHKKQLNNKGVKTQSPKNGNRSKTCRHQVFSPSEQCRPIPPLSRTDCRAAATVISPVHHVG